MSRNLEVWLKGIAAAFIGGGASAVTSAITAPMFAPNDLSYGGHPWRILGMACTTFVISGFFSVMYYLKNSPLAGGNSSSVTPNKAKVAAVVGRS
jgi:hypothetical protein